MKILAAVDGTVHSHDAVKYLIEHINWYRETPTVELVYVHLPLPPLPYKALSADQIRRYYEDEGNASLAKAKDTLDLAGITYAAHILVGPIAETIVKQARITGCDLILLGTRGLGADGNVLLGSTATKVLYFATMPVFIVKSLSPVEHPEWNGACHTAVAPRRGRSQCQERRGIRPRGGAPPRSWICIALRIAAQA